MEGLEEGGHDVEFGKVLEVLEALNSEGVR